MIKEKFLNLVDACKNDRDMLDIIESDMRALGEYVYAVHMMETSLPIIRINYEGQELRDRVEKLDHNRREHHERAIMGVKRLNRFAEMEGVEKIFTVDVNDRYTIADFCRDTAIEMFDDRTGRSLSLVHSEQIVDDKKNMSNNIKFVSENRSKFLTTREYHGYGQILKISDDGIEKHIVVKPKDPVFGITIKFLETGHPQFSIPDVSIDETAIILKNLEAAKAFCMEFYNKRDELIQDAI